MKHWKWKENEKYEPLILRTILLKDIRYLYFFLLAGYSGWIIISYKEFDKLLQDPFFWINIPLYIWVFWALNTIVKKFRNLLELYPETSEISSAFKRTVESFIFSNQIGRFEIIFPTVFILFFIIQWYFTGQLGTDVHSLAFQIGFLIVWGVITMPIFVSLILIIIGVLKGIKNLEERKSIIAEGLLLEDKFSLIHSKQELKPIVDFISTVATYSGIYVIIWNIGVFYVNIKIFHRIDYSTYILGGFGILFVIIVILISYNSLYQIMSEIKERLLVRHSKKYDEIAKKYFECLNGNNESTKQSHRSDLTTVRNIITDLEKSSTNPFEPGIIYKLLLLNSSSFIIPILQIMLRIIFKI